LIVYGRIKNNQRTFTFATSEIFWTRTVELPRRSFLQNIAQPTMKTRVWFTNMVCQKEKQKNLINDLFREPEG
jgi:hypothetical protein